MNKQNLKNLIESIIKELIEQNDFDKILSHIETNSKNESIKQKAKVEIEKLRQITNELSVWMDWLQEHGWTSHKEFLKSFGEINLKEDIANIGIYVSARKDQQNYIDAKFDWQFFKLDDNETSLSFKLNPKKEEFFQPSSSIRAKQRNITNWTEDAVVWKNTLSKVLKTMEPEFPF